MKFYGVEMKGVFKPEIVTSLPTFAAADQSRLVYLTTEKTLYINDGTEYTVASGAAKAVASLPSFSSADEGQLYYDESVNKIYYNNGTEYIVLDNLNVDSLVLITDHVFTDDTARDAYFVSNPSELVDNLLVLSGNKFQTYVLSGGTWLERSIAIRSGVSGAVAAFKGRWEDLTGALPIPASVWHDDKYWILLTDVDDVTSYEPGVDTTYWGLVLHDSEWPPGTSATITFDGDDSTEVYTYGGVEIGRVESVKTTPGTTTVITQSITKNGVDTVETYTFAADGSITITYALAA